MALRKGDPCPLPDCGKPILGREMCSKHYAIWRKHGDPLHPVRRYVRQGDECSDEHCHEKPKWHSMCNKHAKRTYKYGESTDPRERRFWAKVDKDGPIPDDRPDLGPCWAWTGYIHPVTGYGQFGMTGTRLVHRIAYEYVVGPIPAGLHVDHLCKNRACVNAERHLEPVTPRENLERGDQGAFWGYVPEPIPTKPLVQVPLTCTEDDGQCGNPIYKRTICRKHYRRWLRDPDVERPRQRTPEQRFWMKVDKGAPVPEHKPDLGDCWVWTASINSKTGYGRFGPKHGQMMDAHRYSYLLANGSIPEGYDVHHECHRRTCVRPEHLRATTRSENMALRKKRR